MEKSRSPSETVPDEQKLKFLALNCQLRPDNVVSTLKSYTFPLEASLEVCQKYNSLQGQAYIQSRTRHIESAVRIYMQMMNEAIEKHLITHQGYRELSEALFAYQQIEETCKKETEELFEEGAKYFDLFLNFLLKLYQDLDAREEAMTLRPESDFVRYLQLMLFVKIEIFDTFLLVYVARCGTPRFLSILNGHMPKLRLKDFDQFLATLNHEEIMISNIKGRLM